MQLKRRPETRFLAAPEAGFLLPAAAEFRDALRGGVEILLKRQGLVYMANFVAGNTDNSGTPLRVSFEFFPPKTEKSTARLWETVERLTPFTPDFVSVTYGAGGSTRDRTHAIVERLRRETPLEPAAHLTCVEAARAEVDAVARRYYEAGVRHVVALRGDVPDGGPFVPHPKGYASAAELVAGLKRAADFEVSVACHPEVHPDAPSAKADLDNLKAKVDAGASRAMSQFFFDVDTFLRFRDRAVAAGIEVPLVPGILPITNYAKTREFAAMCGATIPDQVARLFDDLDDDPGTRQLVAASVAAEQCRRLQAEGIDEFHFYTLNRAELTAAICRLLGLKPVISESSSPLTGGDRGEGETTVAAARRSPSPLSSPQGRGNECAGAPHGRDMAVPGDGRAHGALLRRVD